MNQDNILAVFQLASLTERREGLAWYATAQAICSDLAVKHDVSDEVAAGVVAALSPRNRWERNVQDADALITAYRFGGREQAEKTKVCTFGKNREKAIRILEEAFADGGVLMILSGPKLKEFYSCIRGIEGEVCIDGHAYCIWAGERTGLKDVPSIGVKLRRQIKADYAAAAAEVNLTPAQLQAVTWVTWRRLHGVTK